MSTQNKTTVLCLLFKLLGLFNTTVYVHYICFVTSESVACLFFALHDLFERNSVYILFVAVNDPAFRNGPDAAAASILACVTCGCKEVSTVFAVVLSAVQRFRAEERSAAVPNPTGVAAAAAEPSARSRDFFGLSVPQVITLAAHDHKPAVLFSCKSLGAFRLVAEFL